MYPSDLSDKEWDFIKANFERKDPRGCKRLWGTGPLNVLYNPFSVVTPIRWARCLVGTVKLKMQ